VTFARPELLSFAPLGVTLLALAVLVQWRRRRELDRGFHGAALRRLFPTASSRFPFARLACLVLASTAIALGAVGIVPRVAEPPPPSAPLDLAVAVDVSASMGASDTDPSRVERARQVVAGLSAGLPGVRTVLVVYADWPYTLVPPTDDPTVVGYFAEALRADLVLDRDQGTSLAAALAHARQALASRPREGARRVILVVSDGDAHDGEAAVLAEAAEAVADGVEVWTAGLGSERGTEIEGGTGPLLDASGLPIVVRLEEELLRQLALAGRGRYERVDDDRGLRALVTSLRGVVGAPTSDGPVPRDATLLLTLLALPLLLIEGALDSGRGVRSSRSAREDA
jgi:Ca-activated chloride channel family protein